MEEIHKKKADSQKMGIRVKMFTGVQYWKSELRFRCIQEFVESAVKVIMMGLTQVMQVQETQHKEHAERRMRINY